jgi:hypothetical protein
VPPVPQAWQTNKGSREILDLYSHVIPGMQEGAAAMVDTALKSAIQKRQEKQW